MTAASADLASGKGHRDENFPVASIILKSRYREPIMAFYHFARAADDVADNATAAPADKLRRLRAMRAGLTGASGSAEALALGDVMRERDLDPRHATDLLDAFEQDVTVARYPDWDALLGYCRVSAMPVGRYVLDVHGEARALWPANDALCAALQIINHVQDCSGDYRALGRVYLPLDTLARHGVRVEELGAPRASPALIAAIRDTAQATADLLAEARPFARGIRDRRLAAEVRVIQRLAENLNDRLLRHDPLSGRVHHSKLEALRLAIPALLAR